jgi:hypothetical protein
MKQQIGPAAVIAGVVVIAVLVFVLYKTFFSSKDPDPAAAAPQHKSMADFYKNQGRPGGGQPGAATQR